MRQHAAKHPILDNVAERSAGSEITMIIMQEQRPIIVGDSDLEDRLGLRSDLGPQTEGVENIAGSVCDRRAAPVKIRAEQGRRVLTIDDTDG